MIYVKLGKIKEAAMKMTVYYNNDSIMEMQNVRSTRQFWRKVSKDCKRFSKWSGKPCRVVKVVKEGNA